MYQKLSQLVGKKFRFHGYDWLLIEILPEIDSLVLRRLEADKSIQTDQYGHPGRKSEDTLTLKISAPDTTAYSDEILTLLSGKR